MTEMRFLSCPSCASRDVMPVVYGSPITWVMEAGAYDEVALGGCIVEPGQPDLFCGACGNAWEFDSAEEGLAFLHEITAALSSPHATRIVELVAATDTAVDIHRAIDAMTGPERTALKDCTVALLRLQKLPIHLDALLVFSDDWEFEDPRSEF